MTTIPIDTIVNVRPGVLSAGGNAANMGAVVLSQAVELTDLQSFTSAAAVATFFGADSNEAKIAQVYFDGYINSTQTPAKLMFFPSVMV